MLRASSDTAVAMATRSLPENPSLIASCRVLCRALTTSASVATGMRVSSGNLAALPYPAPQQRQTFIEVERRRHSLQRQPQLHHRHRHLGLDADDDGLRAAQTDHMSDAAQR